MTKPQSLNLAQSRQQEVNRIQLLKELDFALTHAVQGVSLAQMKSAQKGCLRSAFGTAGGIKQGLKVLGIDVTDPNEFRDLIALGDRILENPNRYGVMWLYYCAGYISFSECCECREKLGDRKRFYKEGQAAIESRFTVLIEGRGLKPPKSLKV